jgi:hypothetical protein
MEEEDFNWDDKKDPENEDEDSNENENTSQDNFSDKLDAATSIYLKLKTYIDFHGLKLLDLPNSISDLVYLI